MAGSKWIPITRGLLAVYGRRMRTDFTDGSFRLLQAVLLSVSRVPFCLIVVVDVGHLSVLCLATYSRFVFARLLMFAEPCNFHLMFFNGNWGLPVFCQKKKHGHHLRVIAN